MAGTIVADTIQDGAGNSTSMDNAIYGSAKAWVTYKGTSTQAILASYNVSSVTNNGTGDYTINFTTAFADANYCPVYGGMAAISTGNWAFVTGYLSAQTTTTLRILVKNDAGTAIDSPSVSVAIHK